MAGLSQNVLFTLRNFPVIHSWCWEEQSRTFLKGFPLLLSPPHNSPDIPGPLSCCSLVVIHVFQQPQLHIDITDCFLGCLGAVFPCLFNVLKVVLGDECNLSVYSKIASALLKSLDLFVFSGLLLFSLSLLLLTSYICHDTCISNLPSDCSEVFSLPLVIIPTSTPKHEQSQYTSFLLLLYQIITNLVALNNTNVLSLSLEARNPKWIVQAKIRVSGELCSFRKLYERIHFLAFSSCLHTLPHGAILHL